MTGVGPKKRPTLETAPPAFCARHDVKMAAALVDAVLGARAADPSVKTAQQVLEALQCHGDWQELTLPTVRRAVTAANAQQPKLMADEKAERRKAKEAERDRKRDRSGRTKQVGSATSATPAASSTVVSFIPDGIDSIMSKLSCGEGEDGDGNHLEQQVNEWLSSGGDANAVQRDFEDVNADDGPTMLELAADQAHHMPLRVFEMLLQHGARVHDAACSSSRALRAAECNLDTCKSAGWQHVVQHVETVIRMLKDGARCGEA